MPASPGKYPPGGIRGSTKSSASVQQRHAEELENSLTQKRKQTRLVPSSLVKHWPWYESSLIKSWPLLPPKEQTRIKLPFLPFFPDGEITAHKCVKKASIHFKLSNLSFYLWSHGVGVHLFPVCTNALPGFLCIFLPKAIDYSSVEVMCLLFYV